jgi:3-phosphoshikimate 1-carboxyvinyltransferase
MYSLSMILRNPLPALRGSIMLPASKSLSNRALVIQYLASQPIVLNHLSTAKDTLLMQKLLNKLQVKQAETWVDCEDAGTVIRFLTAVCATIPDQTFILTGTPRMQERPIHDLVDGLRTLGVQIDYLKQEGYPPIRVHGTLMTKNEVSISGRVSSQYISALCLVGPMLPDGLRIRLRDEIVSKSYIDMTLKLMENFGASSHFENHEIYIPHKPYNSSTYTVESDWSSATFFCAMALLKPCEILLKNLDAASLQGDAWIIQFASYFGIQSLKKGNDLLVISTEKLAYHGPEVLDLILYPDLAIPVIVSCALKWPQVKFTGLHHLEYKESKRLTALTHELRKVGILLNYEDDLLEFEQIEHFNVPTNVKFESYGDHRLAMALSLVCLLGIEVEISNSDCVQKSFPHYWVELKKLGFIPE